MEQTPNNKTPDLLDTTDCLEAIDAIRRMKNFLFLVIVLCLLINGLVFCLDRTDRIDKTDSSICSISPKGSDILPQVEATRNPTTPTTEIRAAAEAVTNTPQTQLQKEVVADPNAKLPKPLPAVFRYKPSCQSIAVVLNISNFILVLAAIMFCLVLLMALKISLTGRLGGISHISRAFFISLFALVILLPWQVLLPGVVAGAIYTPQELLCQWDSIIQDSTFWLVMCYMRFTGLWLATLLLFSWAQLRSGKWSRATLRRLGLVR